jgi:Cu-Zn family superoxide dismutase
MKISVPVLAAVLACASSATFAADVTIKVRAVTNSGIGKEIGTIRAVDTKKGLRLVPRLTGLTSGPHGFHLHENPSCAPKGAGGKMGAALAAGGHFDPERAGAHTGPMGKGHLGDLPALVADAKGEARNTVLAPRLKVDDLWGRALVVHAGGDNYSDQPAALGGGGARVACARIVKAKPGTKAKKG